MSKVRFLAALIAGKLCSAFCKVFFPTRGSNLPGSIALKLDPLFLTHVRGVEISKTVFITGTNGKSTANNMAVHAFRADGRSVCSNLEGANMKPGVAAALIKNTTMGGRFKRDYLILEIDERSLETISKDLKPGCLCVTNIQKDQVQRNGDPDFIYQKIKRTVSGLDNLTLYVNNEEPRSKSLGKYIRNGGRVISFGVAENERFSSVEDDFGITMPCPVCYEALVFSHRNLANVGAFSCPKCDLASDEKPDYQISDVDYDNNSFMVGSCGTRFINISFKLNYPAAFFLYNYSLCVSLCAEFGIGPDVLSDAFDTFTNIAGRMESFSHKGKTVRYLRIKQENPETLQSALDTIAEDRSVKVFAAGPDTVNDIIPWYSNTFYTYDCNFRPLIESGVEKYICFGSVVCWDMFNRLRYAGVPGDMIEILDTDDEAKILGAIASADTGNIYLITLLKKYEYLKRLAK